MKKSPTERWGIFLPVEAPLSHHYEKKGNYNWGLVDHYDPQGLTLTRAS